MYLQIKSRTDYASKNENFSKIISPLLNYIFNSNKVVFDYLESTSNNFQNQRHHILDARETEKTIIASPSIPEDCDDKGIFEETLKNNIISQDYAVLIFTGASGSGKSSIINHIRNNLNECENKEGCMRYDLCKRHKKTLLYHDFLDSPADEQISSIMDTYEFKMNAHLNMAVRNCFAHDSVLTDFLNQCENSTDPEIFQLSLMLRPINPNWTIYELLSKLMQGEKSITTQNNILTSMLHYFRKQYPQHHKGCFIIIYDNIDKLIDSEQSEIIKKIKSLHNSVKCKLVITSRLTTFYKIDDKFSNTTNIIENAGPRPIDVIAHRIKYYLDNRETIHDIIDTRNRVKSVEQISKEIKKVNYLEHFDNLLYHLLTFLTPMEEETGEYNEQIKILNNHKEIIQKTLSAYSGLSVRRGIELSKRFIDSFVYNYDDIPSANHLAASLSFRTIRGIDFKDKLITNIYARYNDNNKNSWLIYKVLNILMVCYKNELPLSVLNLYQILKLYGGEVDEDLFLTAINTVILSDKRLAYISELSEIKKIDKESYLSQNIHITNAGIDYFNFLATDLSYIQNSFAALNWETIGNSYQQKEIKELLELNNHNRINSCEANRLYDLIKYHIDNLYFQNMPKVFNVGNIYERMQFLRICLEIKLHHDVMESYYFNKRKYDKKYISKIVQFMHYSDYINSFPSLRLILTCSNSFIRIIRSYIKKDNSTEINLEELNSWCNLIQNAELWHKALFGKSVNESDKLISDFVDIIGRKPVANTRS